MSEIRKLSDHRTALKAEPWQPVSTALPDLLKSAGYRPIAPNREKEELATAATTILLGNYRRDDAASGEIRFVAFVAALAEYPDECIRYVTDPRTGIQSFDYRILDRKGHEVRGPFKSFPPEVGELQEACEQYMAPIRRWAERERRESESIARAAEIAAEEAQRATRPTLAEPRAKHGLRPASGSSSIENRAAAIARGLEHAVSAERVRADLEQRRQRSLPAPAEASP